MGDSNLHEEAVPPELRALLVVFEEALGDVTFPDVDAAVLAAAAKEVQERAEAVERAQKTVAAAQQALEEGQEKLRAKALRALAYARVFAEGDAALTERLESIQLERPLRRSLRSAVGDAPATDTAPRRRGRPPKDKRSDLLFSVADSPSVMDAAAG